MEIFNIHIFEFLLIAGLALVIFGPERLPEVGRMIGQQVAKFLAWQQQSPELQMLNEVRSEFEREIASLRDELVRTRQQLDLSSEVSAIKEDLRPMLDLKGNLQAPPPAANGVKAPGPAAPPEPTIAPPELAAPQPVGAAEVAEAAADLAAPDAPITVRPAAQTVPAAQPGRLAHAQPTTALGTPGPSAGDQAFAEAPPAPPDDPEPAPEAATDAHADHPAPAPEEASELAIDAPPGDPAPEPAPEAASELATEAPAGDPAPEPAPAPDAPAAAEPRASDERLEYLRQRRAGLHDAPEPEPAAEPEPAPAPALDAVERDELLRRLQGLAADLQALTAELQERGVLRADWQQPAQPPEQETIPR